MTPVAVLGASRSGTAIVAQALAAALGVPVAFRRELTADTDGILCAPDQRLACPNLHDAAGYLDHLPQAKAVALWRHPIDFVNSRRRAAPDQDFVSHCRLWTNAMAAIGALHARHRERMAVIAYEALLNSRAALGLSLLPLFGETPDFAHKFCDYLAGHQPGRTALRLGKPVTALKDVGWSDAERAVFEGICGETLRRIGLAAHLAGPKPPIRLDTGRSLPEMARARGGLAIAPPVRRGAPCALIRADHEALDPPCLWLPAVATGGRRRFGLSLSNQAGQLTELYLEVAETLSCRLLHVQNIVLEPWSHMVLEAILPPSETLIDVILTITSPQNPVAFRIALDEIVFRQAPAGAKNGF